MKGNTSVLNDEGFKDKIKNEIKFFLELNENEDTTQQNCPEHSKTSPKKDVFITVYVTRQIRKSTNNNLIMYFKILERQKHKI